MRHFFMMTAGVLIILACTSTSPQKNQYDLIIRHGTIYDGTGSTPFTGDVAINADTIVAIGDLSNDAGKKEIDATGLVVAPGFINMLSWADRSLLMDGRSVSDIKQGVTLEVFGEGWSPGPVKRKATAKPVDSLWTTLGGYFRWLMKKGSTPNVASFVGATSIRLHELGHENRAPSPPELERMKNLVKQAMEEGAMGLGSSLIYAPADYASTEELIALSKVAAQYGGIYTTHMRSEGDFILKGLNETFRIAKEANIPAEIYHLKINIARNWPKIDTVLFKIDSARKAGLKITANNYPYIASATGLTARLPNWVQEGGAQAMRKRLRDPQTRKKVLYEMGKGIPYKNSDPKDVQMLGFRLDSLNKLYRGKRLDEVAKMHGKNADETVIDLVMRDKSTIAAVYYQQSEDNIRRIIQQPYVSFGSDGASMSDLKIFADWGTHPRAYGTFARFVGKYVRDEKLVSLEEAIRRLTSLPASNLSIKKRGALKKGFYADIAIFNYNAVQDKATFDNPKAYATGMVHVLVNGVVVLKNGEHTGAKPGRVVRGPGWNGKN
ncbi:N-acyl-D-amino-acid deacylase family protein [Pseudochryseolinea flava]|uniref:D-aminoacylase n=1 Tax=Pseudochryseolinea flava TaxID=2059302 RepID=A0A364Y3Z8_9BACT|nr:D-aminoacylase [Pseudochryseolinea flava]RAW01054.1 D-aminoacylase [Pseudochryseolinea flava]